MHGLPRWLSGKEITCPAGDAGWIPGSGRSPGKGNGNPLQYSCLENPMGQRSLVATVQGSQSKTRLSDYTTTPVPQTDNFDGPVFNQSFFNNIYKTMEEGLALDFLRRDK